MKKQLFLFVIFLITAKSNIAANSHNEVWGAELSQERDGKSETHDTTLLDEPLPPMGVLQLQAAERRRFYDDLAAEKQELQKELNHREESLRERQRQERKNFHPESHSIAERRDFFITQRREMVELKKSQRDSFHTLQMEQKKRREEFHGRQKKERMEAIKQKIQGRSSS